MIGLTATPYRQQYLLHRYMTYFRSNNSTLIARNWDWILPRLIKSEVILDLKEIVDFLSATYEQSYQYVPNSCTGYRKEIIEPSEITTTFLMKDVFGTITDFQTYSNVKEQWRTIQYTQEHIYSFSLQSPRFGWTFSLYFNV